MSATALWRDRRFQSVIVIALMVVGALVLVVDTLMMWHAEARALALHEERTALLERKAAGSGTNAAEVPAIDFGPGRILLDSQTSALVSAELQRLLSERVERVGAIIRSVDIPADGLNAIDAEQALGPLERVRLTAEIEVLEQSLADLLYAIEAETPVMVVDSFRLRLNRRIDASGDNQDSSDRPLSLSISLSAFREKGSDS